jgi:hypothetical protein
MEDLSEEAYLPPKLIEEEAIRVAMILSKEEEKRRWADNDIDLADMPPQQARDKHHGNLPEPPPESHALPPHPRLRLRRPGRG